MTTNQQDTHTPKHKDQALWREIAESSLKGVKLEKILNKSTVEGVDYKGLYDGRNFQMEHYSFPDSFQTASVYDSGIVKAEDIQKDQEIGADNTVLVVKGKSWNNSFPSNLNVTYFLQITDDETFQKFSSNQNVYVDINKLLFKDFKAEVDRVKSAGFGFAVNISQIHNAGASCVQEINYALNMLSLLMECNVEAEKIAMFTAADSMFFMNIAKLRTLRFLSEEVLLAYGKDPKVQIHCASSLREQTIYDPWVNMLRDCASSMAAVLGGADLIGIRPWDAAFSALTLEDTTDMSRRAAQNTLNILREESNIGFVKDAGKGSFAIEELSRELALQSWEAFLNWQEKGFLENIKEFSTTIEAIAKLRFEKVRNRKKSITGINDFANPDETILELYKKPWSPVDLMSGLFPLRRVASEFEHLRIRAEKAQNTPKVALIYKGKLSALSARINFAKNVFETVGLKIEEFVVEGELSETIAKAKEKECTVALFVGKDEEYANWINAKDTNTFKSKFIAGKLENMNLENGKELRDIYMGKNIYKELKEMLDREGVE